MPLSAAIGVSGSAIAAISSDADLDLDAAELDALVVLELAAYGQEACPCVSAEIVSVSARAAASCGLRFRAVEGRQAGSPG